MDSESEKEKEPIQLELVKIIALLSKMIVSE